MTQENGSKPLSNLSVPRSILIELFSIIHSEGLWGLLSLPTQEFGEQLYLEETGNKLSVPPSAMKYSLDQHLELINQIVPMQAKATDFWRIVIQITWFMMAIEKNPLLAQEIRNTKSPESLVDKLGIHRSKNE